MSLLIVDDHAVTRQGMRHFIARHAGAAPILEAGDCAAALALVMRGEISVILLDPGLPDARDLEALERLRAAAPDVPVIVFSADDRAEQVRRAIEGGARSFISKGADAESFAAALEAALAGHVRVPDSSIAEEARARPGASTASFRSQMSASIERLTPRQREVLGLLVDGLTNKLIGRALGISPETAKIHVSGVLKALGVPTRARAVVAAAAAGFRLPARRESFNPSGAS